MEYEYIIVVLKLIDMFLSLFWITTISKQPWTVIIIIINTMVNLMPEMYVCQLEKQSYVWNFTASFWI